MAEKESKTQISFEGPNLPSESPTVTIKGLPSEHVNRPERILKLMELLELPEGTNARIIYTAEDVIVR